MQSKKPLTSDNAHRLSLARMREEFIQKARNCQGCAQRREVMKQWKDQVKKRFS